LGDLSEDEIYQKMFGDPTPVSEKAKPLPDSVLSLELYAQEE